MHAHQNTSYTLCPGKYLYPQMSTIRSKAATYAMAAAPIVAPPPAPVSGSKLYATYGSLTLAAGSTGLLRPRPAARAGTSGVRASEPLTATSAR